MEPVIIIGETGVGKTAIITYLKDVLNIMCEIRNIHEGISDENIISYIDEAESYCRDNEDKLYILFFDEVNTNVNVSGLMKEILIDRHC